MWDLGTALPCPPPLCAAGSPIPELSALAWDERITDFGLQLPDETRVLVQPSPSAVCWLRSS